MVASNIPFHEIYDSDEMVIFIQQDHPMKSSNYASKFPVNVTAVIAIVLVMTSMATIQGNQFVVKFSVNIDDLDDPKRLYTIVTSHLFHTGFEWTFPLFLFVLLVSSTTEIRQGSVTYGIVLFPSCLVGTVTQLLWMHYNEQRLLLFGFSGMVQAVAAMTSINIVMNFEKISVDMQYRQVLKASLDIVFLVVAASFPAYDLFCLLGYGIENGNTAYGTHFGSFVFAALLSGVIFTSSRWWPVACRVACGALAALCALVLVVVVFSVDLSIINGAKSMSTIDL
ncbi:hypothetical protein QR680_013450 [Steinernema hermaphroditum]|uniref:Peptidase S54 rhomboid domain-containing protein n=1 Tax=Steinernema hermaphroditum TaxID=289476 RepID=A0AA39I5J8_9BILA|nr:hypothetical protein QR680_013450 [Steinernema hermaphroditum]